MQIILISDTILEIYMIYIFVFFINLFPIICNNSYLFIYILNSKYWQRWSLHRVPSLLKCYPLSHNLNIPHVNLHIVLQTLSKSYSCKKNKSSTSQMAT